MTFTRKGNFQTFIRRYPSVALFCLVIILVQFASYYYGNGPTDTETARSFGAIQSGNTSPEEWSRLVTYIFLQIGGMYHFLASFASLLILGPPLERIYGSAKFTFLFLMTGIVGGLFILVFSTNVIAAGASGSIFGLLGLYVGLIVKKNTMIGVENKSFIWAIIAINIVYTFVGPNVSISAHLGGFVGGILLSLLVPTQSFKQLAQRKWSESVFHTIMVTSVIIFSLFMAKEIPLNTYNQALLKVDEIRFQLSNDENSVVKSETQTNDSIETISVVENGDVEQEIQDNSYENYELGINAIMLGNLEKGITYLTQISKNSELYDEAVAHIQTAERQLYMERANFIDYRLLKKDAEQYKDLDAFFKGEISFIQEINNKTVMVITLITSQSQFDIEQIIVLYPERTHLIEGENVTVYGNVVGSFYKKFDFIRKYLKLRVNQDVFIPLSAFTTNNLVPVVDTKIIDHEGWLIY